jgi:hypothetical protein
LRVVLPSITAVVVVAMVPSITVVAVGPNSFAVVASRSLRRRRFTFTASRRAEFRAVLIGTASALADLFPAG